MWKSLCIFFLLTIALYALPNFSKAQKEKYLYPLGEKIYKKRCSKIDIKRFQTFDALYRYIKKRCNLKEKRYNIALAYYLWDATKKKKRNVAFTYTKKDRCAVCGMFVYKHPKWIAMIITKKGKKIYFDGVKDMMKYFFSNRNDDAKGFYAQDYYSKEIFNLKKGYVVTGSDVYGAMGEELIPFTHLQAARRFMVEHRGKQLVSFDKITARLIEAIDE